MTQIQNLAGKMRLGGSATVGRKISYVIGLCLALVIVVAATGIIQMQSINTEIEGIAERDVPLTNAVTAITVHQLEQAINFERALRLGVEMKSNSHAQAAFEKAVHEFEALSAKVDKELKEGEALAKVAGEHAASAAARAEFERVGKMLTKIDGEHAAYEEHAITALKLLAAGDVAPAMKLAEKIVVEEEKLDHELEALLREIGQFTEQAAKTAQTHEQFAVSLMTAVSLIGFVVVALLAWVVVSRSISRPLTQVTGAIEALSAGDTTVEITVNSDDEIGAVAKSLDAFKESMRENQRMQKEQEEQKSRAAQERQKIMAELADSFETKVGDVIKSVASSSTEMQSSAQAMTKTADVTSEQSSTVAAASEEATTNVQMVAAAAEELTASITEISRQVAQSATMAKEAVQDAEVTDQNIQSLAEAAQRIGEVINLINDIASQTNLLALNATIEAARAGDAGKGFAVVASEVKSLAEQTAKATDEIASQISAMQAATSVAVEAVQQIGKKISEFDSVSSAIASAVEEQGASTQEIANNVQQAAAGTQAVTENISNVTQGASETGAAAGQVLSAAEELSRQSNDLRASVDGFLEEVRAA